jgi:hypothetical protein
LSAREIVVLDGRQTQAVTVGRDELALLAERCEARKLSTARSVYLALLEAAGSAQAWDRKATAARAGVSESLLARTIAELEYFGFLRYRDDGRVQLGVGPVAQDRGAPVKKDVPKEPPKHSERAERFWEFHAARVRSLHGCDPPKGPAQFAAADRILDREQDATEIKARLDWALARPFYASKVTTLAGFDRWWARIAADYLAERTAPNGRASQPSPDPAWRSVSYESDRVKIS